MFRNDTLVSDCDTWVAGASRDPCIASRMTLESGAAQLTIRTSQASHWNVGKGGFKVMGLFQPVDNRPVPRSVLTACDSSAAVDAIEQTVNAGGSSLSYDATGNEYTYPWKTDKTWSAAPGGPCRQLVLSFVDGHSLRANFIFN